MSALPAFSTGDTGDIGDTLQNQGFRRPHPVPTAGDTGDKSIDERTELPAQAPQRGETCPMCGRTGNPVAHFDLLERHARDRQAGVYWVAVRADKETGAESYASPAWISSPLKVTAMTRNAQGEAWGRLLIFPDRDGRNHSWCAPMSLFAGSGEELRATLLSGGMTLTTNANLRRHIGDYIQQERPNVTARCVDRTGWHGNVFVLPRETLGDTEANPVLFQAANIEGVSIGTGGTLEGWREQVARPCAGNSRLVLALSAAFAAPCLGLIGMEGGGFHLRGGSSSGKSTALAVAASMYGAPEQYCKTWRHTDNGLEGAAALHSDLLLVLDELGQLDPKHAGAVAYLLANGQGKGRSNRDGSPRALATWRVLFLSAGEIGLGDMVTQSGGKPRAGQEVRVIDLPADAGAGLGAFEYVPAGMLPGAFSDAFKRACAEHFGHALPAFLKAILSDVDAARESLRTVRDEEAAVLAGEDASGQVRRVAQRFGLVAAAGELATQSGLTGWAQGEATKAAVTCFKAWLAARGGAGNAEPAAMLAQVRAFLGANGDARFTLWNSNGEGLRTANRAGFRKPGVDGPTYYIEAEVFRGEVCTGFDPLQVARALLDAGALLPGGDGRMTQKPKLPDNRRARVYVITPALWDAE